MNRNSAIVAVLLIIVAVLFLFADPLLTGFVIMPDGSASLTIPVNETLTASAMNVPLNGSMRVLRISIVGSGIGAEPYVRIAGREYELTEEAGDALSGLATGLVPEVSDPLDPQRVHPSEERVQTRLGYGEGPYDVDDDGIVGQHDAVDFLVDEPAQCVAWSIVSESASLVCRGNGACCRQMGFPSSNIEEGSANELVLTRDTADGSRGRVLARTPNASFSEPLPFDFTGTAETYRAYSDSCGEACSLDHIARSIEIGTRTGRLTIDSVEIVYAPLSGLADETRIDYTPADHPQNRTASDEEPARVRVQAELLERLERGQQVRALIRTDSGVFSESITRSDLDDLARSGTVHEAAIDQRVSVFTTRALDITRISTVSDDHGLTGAGTSVCIIDTGVELSILRDARVEHETYSVLDNTTDVSDGHGHGTMVTYPLVQAAPGARYIIIKALDDSGAGYESDVLAALDACEERGADIVSLSIGSGLYDGLCDANFVADRVNRLVANGTVVIAAAGNEGAALLKSPACASNATAVIATDDTDEMWSTSSYLEGHAVLAAPGVAIETRDGNGNVFSASGTSMSVPFVSGATALLLENRSELAPLEVRSRLVRSGDVFNTSTITYARLDVQNAVDGTVTNDLLGDAEQGNGSSDGFALVLAQTGRPSSDIAIGSWTDDGGGTTDLYLAIDEVTASDADFVRSENDPADSAADFGLGSLVDPNTHENHTVRYRYRKQESGGGQAATLDVTVELRHGSDRIASTRHVDVGTSFADGSFTLSTSSASQIDNYNDLRFRFIANVTGGARTSWGEVSWAELELPDAQASVNQSGYRFFNNINSTSVGTALAGQDTPVSAFSAGGAFRLRSLIHVGAANLSQGVQSFNLQYAPLGPYASCSVIPTADYTNVPFGPYNSAAASFSQSISTQDSQSTGIAWNGNGTKLYEVGEGSDLIYEYTLSTPYDISTASFSQSISTQDSQPMGIAWNGDGTKLYETGSNSDLIYESNLSTPYDISTASFSQSISAQDIQPSDIAFNDDGTRMYESGLGEDPLNSADQTIYEYILSTPYDISTASFSESIDAKDGRSTGIAWNNNGTKFYEVGAMSDLVYEYDIPLAIVWNDNSVPQDGSALSASASDPVHDTDTTRDQTYIESNPFNNSQSAIAAGEDGMWDFSLQADANLSDTATYCFRIVKSNDALTGYNSYPEITITSNDNLPIYSKFNGETTDFTVVANLSATPQPILENVTSGRIRWNGVVNVSRQDFNTYVNITNGSISVDSVNLHSSLNSSVNLSFYGLSFRSAVIRKDGVLCGAPSCNVTSYTGGVLNVSVAGFSNYTPDEGDFVRFVDPTPSNGSAASSAIINTTIDRGDIASLNYTSNQTFRVYDDLLLAFNLDNNSALGENDTHVYDITDNGHNGTAGTGTAPTANGYYDGGFTFDGTNNDGAIVVSHQNSLNWGSDDGRSFSLWFKKDTECLSENSNEVFASRWGTDHALGTWWLGCYDSADANANQLRFRFGVSLSTSYNLIGPAVNDSQWHHAAWTYDPIDDTIRLYYDGEQVDSWASVVFGANFTATNDLCIGAYNTGCNEYEFNGTIDEVRYYNRTLNTSEIDFLARSNLKRVNDSVWNLQVNETMSEDRTFSVSASTTEGFEDNETITLLAATTCGTISSSGTYILAENVSSTGTCFDVNVDDVTINCDGYTITYGTGGSGYGIDARSQHGVSVENCNIDSGSSDADHGVAYFKSNRNRVNNTNVTIDNDIADGNTAVGIAVEDASNHTNITNVRVTVTGEEIGTATGWGIYSDEGSTNLLLENATVNVTHPSATIEGIRFWRDVINITFRWVTVQTTKDTAIHLDQSPTNALFEHVWVKNNDSGSQAAIKPTFDANLTFVNFTALTTDPGGGYSVIFGDDAQSAVYFYNSTFENLLSPGSLDVRLNTDTGSNERIHFINASWTHDISWGSTADGDIVFNGYYVDVRVVDGSGDPIQGATINYSDGGSHVNNPSASGTTTSGSDGWSRDNIIYDFEMVYNNVKNPYNNYTFTATYEGFSNSTVANITGNDQVTITLSEVSSLTTCQTISISGYYTLGQNVSSMGTCFEINASGTVLDCAGYTINYSQSSSGHGVLIHEGISDTEVKGCTIVQGGTDSASHAVYVNGSNAMPSSVATISGSNITTSGSGSSGIKAQQMHDNVTYLTLDVAGAVLPVASQGAGCATSSQNGMIYCFGGQKDGTTYSNVIDRYDPFTDTASRLSATLGNAAIFNSCAESSVDQNIYCFGGQTSAFGYSSAIDRFDPDTEAVTRMNATLPSQSTSLSCVESSYDQRIYCFGGRTGSFSRSDAIWYYNVSSDASGTMTATMPVASNTHRCANSPVTDLIYCFGGNDGSPRDTIFKFDPSADATTTLSATLPVPLGQQFCDTLTMDDAIYCVGGFDEDTYYERYVYRFDPITETYHNTTHETGGAWLTRSGSVLPDKRGFAILGGRNESSSYEDAILLHNLSRLGGNLSITDTNVTVTGTGSVGIDLVAAAGNSLGTTRIRLEGTDATGLRLQGADATSITGTVLTLAAANTTGVSSVSTKNASFTDATVSGDQDGSVGVVLNGSLNITLTNSSISLSGTSTDDVRIDDASNSSKLSGINGSGGTLSIRSSLYAETLSHYLLDTPATLTFQSANSGRFHIGWYVDVYVNDTLGSPLSATVDHTDSGTYSTLNPNPSGSTTSGSDGYVRDLEIYEYMKNSSAQYFYTNYTFNASKSDHGNDSATVNVTNNMQVNLTLLANVIAVSDALLNATSIYNISSDNLTVSYAVDGQQSTGAGNTTDWRLEGASITVLNMPFNENISNTSTGSLPDYSTYTNNGTLGNGTAAQVPTWRSDCIVGGCYEFDATDDIIVVPHHASLQPKTKISVSAWIYRTGSGQSATSIIVGKQDADEAKQVYSLGLASNDSIRWRIMQSDSATSTDEIYSDAAVPVNEWVHVLGTYDAGTFRLYINGALNTTGSFAGPGDIRDDGNVLTVGSDYTIPTNRRFPGRIDEVRVYDRVLSPEQIQQEYLDGSNGDAVSTMVKQETNAGETWSVAITAFDETKVSSTITTNELLIDEHPVVENATITSTSGSGLSRDNLTANFDAVNRLGGIVTNVTDWRINGSSIALVNMPFNVNSSERALSYTTDYNRSITVQISQSSDDAEEHAGGTMEALSSSDLELVEESDTQIVGLRWQDLDIPRGATITGAVIEFQVDEANSGATSLSFYGQDAGNALTFSSSDNDISSRTKTSESMLWQNIPSWDTLGERKQTPDLSNVIQEIVNRSDWNPGNALAIIINGSGKRVAESVDGTYGAELHINYSGPHSGSVINGPLWNATCIVGGCYWYSASDEYVSIDSSTDLDIYNSGGYSVSFWTKMNGTCDSGHSSGNEVMLTRWDTTGLWWVGCDGDDGDAEDNEVRVEIEDDSGSRVILTGGVEINDSSWHHVAFTYDGTAQSLILYVDGTQVNSTSTSTLTANVTSPNPVCIGQYGAGCDNTVFAYDGFIDEVLIVNRTLSPEQIRSIRDDQNQGKAVLTLVSNETGVNDSVSFAVTVFDETTQGQTAVSSAVHIRASTCTTPGSGDWAVTISDNCTVTGTVNVAPNKLVLSGSGGTFTIASGGTLIVQDVHYEPDVFDGTSTFIVESGGDLRVEP